MATVALAEDLQDQAQRVSQQVGMHPSEIIVLALQLGLDVLEQQFEEVRSSGRID